MKYTKVLSTSRFSTRAQPNFAVDGREKRVIAGRRDAGPGRAAYLGKLMEHGKNSNLLDYNVFVDIEFPHVVGIFGSRGSGKSFDLGVLLEGIFLREDLAAPAAARDAAVVFDVQDQFWTLSFSPNTGVESDQVQLADLGRWSLQPAALDNLRIYVPAGSDTQVPNCERFMLAADQLAVDDWLALLELERFSAMGQAMMSLLKAEGARAPGELAARVQNGSLAGFQQGTIEGLRWRLESIANSMLIADTGISIDELLRPNCLSVILLRNLSESLRGLVVGVISRLAADRMGRLQQARKVAARTAPAVVPEDNITGRLWMFLDEAHVLVPSDGTTPATAPLIDYVKRGRDAGLSLVFATQQPSAVNTKLLSQVDMTLTHMLGFDADISAAVARMPTRTSVEYDIDNQHTGGVADVIRSLGPGEAVVADGASSRIFLTKVRPRVSAHGGVTPK